MTEYDARVTRGVAFLDSNAIIPANWRELIDLDTFDIANEEDCILGQIAIHLYGYEDEGSFCFSDMIKELNLSLGEAGDSGFVWVQQEFNYGTYLTAADALTEAWKRYLTNYEH